MIVDVDRYGTFRLGDDFLEAYRGRPVGWGFGDLSRVTYERTYAREGEDWLGTCRRVVEGMFTVLRTHRLERGLPWDEGSARALAEDALARLWDFRWTPPGRGLWIMGTRFVYERGGAALDNCGFVSTRDVDQDFAGSFVWMLSMSMLGVGVGFDTRGAGRVTVEPPANDDHPHVVGDSREGWAEALGRLLRAYVGEGTLPSRWDTSLIRPRGTRLESFGGVASGPAPLEKMLASLQALYDGYVGRKIDSRLIVDTMNLVGRCVVAGGIRRSAQIALGDPDDVDFLDLKQDPEKLADYRWVSNNSLYAHVGMDYAEAARRTARNGEPGYLWLANARGRGRMADPPDDRDAAALGSNPCAEQTLWDRELCCLVETFPARHATLDDYRRTLRVAYLYAKAVTLVPTHDAATNAVMLRNRRIGCSMTGVVQAVHRHGYRRFLQWCDAAFRTVQDLDRLYSDALCVPRSIKTTSVKPSGTVSILAGATPGVHWDHAPYYLRRIRLAEHHPLAEQCREAGYSVEPDAYSDATVVVSFPVHVPGMPRAKSDVPLWEKVDLAARLQHYWADNQVSCTVECGPGDGAETIARVLAAYEDRLKAISFVPAERHGYAQPPYEAISRERYESLRAGIAPLRGGLEHEQEAGDTCCEGGTCATDPHDV